MKGLALDSANRYPSRNAWLNDLHQVNRRFHNTPELSGFEKLLTQVVGWFGSLVKPWSKT